MKTKRLIATIPVMLLAILACSLGGQSPAVPTGAQTLTALAENAAPNSTPQADGTAGALSTGKPVIHVNQLTDCRSGPSTAFDNLDALPAGFEAEVIGKDTADDYLLITMPAGNKCWLDAHAAALSGDASAVPEVPPPPTPTLSPTPTASPTATVSPSPTASNTPITPAPHLPAMPRDLQVIKNCAPLPIPGGILLYQYGLVVRWTDMADNESNYWVTYTFPGTSDGKLQVRPADTTLDQQMFGGHAPGITVSISVRAHNAVGESLAATTTITCP